MSNQMESGWYPECSECECGNLGAGAITLCSRCKKKYISLEWLEKEIDRMKKEDYPDVMIDARARGVLNDLLQTIRKQAKKAGE